METFHFSDHPFYGHPMVFCSCNRLRGLKQWRNPNDIMEAEKMNLNCVNILKWTEAQLKYTYDVSLKDATPQELHEALGQAVMMAISDNWSHAKKTRMHERKAYYISAEYLIGRLVYSNLFNLGILDEMKKLFAERGVDLVPFRYVGAGHLLVVDHHGHPHRVDAGNHTVHTFLFAIFKYVI